MIQYEIIDTDTGDIHHEYWYDASDCAKFLMIKIDGKILGRNKFLQYLRNNKLIMKDSNQPTQQWISLGLARWHSTTKRWKTFGMPLWSERGLNRLKVMVANGDLQPGFEKRREKHVVLLNDIC
jgi:hypothetical protein